VARNLQAIEDYYVNQGLVGDKLRQAIEEDSEYQEILRSRKARLHKEVEIYDAEVGKYVLSTEKDYEILTKIRQLENKNLSSSDRELIELIKTQLELDWRSPILGKLDELLGKYK